MRLASHLHRTEAEAKRTVSFYEFYRWQAFYELEPWGRQAETLQLAKIGDAAANAFGNSGRTAESFLSPIPEWLTEPDDGDNDPLGWFSRERNRKP